MPPHTRPRRLPFQLQRHSASWMAGFLLNGARYCSLFTLLLIRVRVKLTEDYGEIFLREGKYYVQLTDSHKLELFS